MQYKDGVQKDKKATFVNFPWQLLQLQQLSQVMTHDSHESGGVCEQ